MPHRRGCQAMQNGEFTNRSGGSLRPWPATSCWESTTDRSLHSLKCWLAERDGTVAERQESRPVLRIAVSLDVFRYRPNPKMNLDKPLARA